MSSRHTRDLDGAGDSSSSKSRPQHARRPSQSRELSRAEVRQSGGRAPNPIDLFPANSPGVAGAANDSVISAAHEAGRSRGANFAEGLHLNE